MKRKILTLIYFISYYLGITHLFYWINRKEQRVLVYHHIIDDSHINGTFEQKLVCTPKSLFEKQIQIVNKRFKVTTILGEPNSAILTFDDGYRCALIAETVLSKYDNLAYIFMPVNNVDSKMPLWIDMIMAWFSYVPEGEYFLNNKKLVFTDNISRRMAFSDTIDYLYTNYDKCQLLDELNIIYPFKTLNIDKNYYTYRFQGLTIEEIKTFKPKIVFVDENNKISSIKEEV